jgi:hypothetical protein
VVVEVSVMSSDSLGVHDGRACESPEHDIGRLFAAIVKPRPHSSIDLPGYTSASLTDIAFVSGGWKFVEQQSDLDSVVGSALLHMGSASNVVDYGKNREFVRMIRCMHPAICMA